MLPVSFILIGDETQLVNMKEVSISLFSDIPRALLRTQNRYEVAVSCSPVTVRPG
jgi:hypothetical protein